MLQADVCNFRHVSGSDLLVGGTYVYNHYHDCLDKNYLMAGDQILDVIALPQEKVQIPILLILFSILTMLGY